MSKLTVLDQDGLALDIGEDEEQQCDMIVTVDNPEKHPSTMESYLTFRVSTKVFVFNINYFIVEVIDE